MARHTTIGILLPVLNAGYDMEVLAGAHTVARRQHAQLIAIWGSAADLRATSLSWEQVDGWIAVHNIPRPQALVELAQTGVPLVAIGALVPGLNCPAVLPDNYRGTLAATRHLLDHGHQRIAFLGDLRVYDMRERYAGYQAALAERGIALDERLVFGDANYYGTPVGGARAAQNLIDAQFEYSAIVAGNDLYAFEVIKSMQEAGYRVPGDLAVVGFDDLPEARAATPALTTVRQSYSSLGSVAAELLLSLLRGQAVAPGPTYIPTALTIRRSCGCTTTQLLSPSIADEQYTSPDWQDALAHELVRLVAYPLQPDSTVEPSKLWPGVDTLIQGLDAAVTGTAPDNVSELDLGCAWREAIERTTNLEALHAMLKLLAQAAERHTAAAHDTAMTSARVQSFLDQAHIELMQAQQSYALDRDAAREQLLQINYAINMALLDQNQGKAAHLDWLSLTPLPWACLGLWAEAGANGARSLVVVGTYSREGSHAIAPDSRYPAEAFPPLDALPASAREGGPDVTILLPVRTATHDWGILAVCRPAKSRAAQSTDEDVRMWATLLGAALERESLLESLTGQQNTLSAAYEQRLITESIRDLVFMLDLSGRFLYSSPSFRHVLGYNPTGLLGISAFDLIHPDDVAAVQDPWVQVRTPGAIQATFRFRHSDGSWRWLEVSGTAVARQGEPSVVVVGRDISDRKRLEAEVLQSQKMDSIGRLAGGVAHDFNNLLTVITGHTELAIESLSPTDPLRSDLVDIRKAAQRAADLTSQLLAFARKQMIEPRVLNLNDLILDTNKLLRRLIGEDIELMTVTDPDLRHVKIDPGQIEQLLVNLAINSRDAMPNGGRLTIATANVVLKPREAIRHIGVSPGSYVSLTVQDTGGGMDAEAQSHLFEPFFTTKELGKGTGLGLATCYGIVKQHGGHILVSSAVGQGTTMTILLPPEEQVAVVAPRHDITQLPPRATETILLVEDEVAVRNLASRLLRRQGYAVLEAANGAEALRIAREHNGPIELLLTDIVMPQISGKAVAERLRAMRPGMKVLFMSGYTDANVINQGAPDHGTAFVQKPFSPLTLTLKLRELLDA